MTSTLLYLLLHLVFCTIYFIAVARPVFLCVNRRYDESGSPVSRRDLADMTRHGLRSDLAASAYLTALPLLVLWVHAHAPVFGVKAALMTVDAVVALLLASLTVADNMLYGEWKFRIDASIFGYLRHPAAAFASVSPGVLVLGVIVILAIAAVIFGILYCLGVLSGVFANPIQAHTAGEHLLTALVFLVAAAVVFSLIRGLNHRPKSPYMAYYCTNMLYNHAAVNPLFNIIFNLTSGKKADRQFMVYDADQVSEEMRRMMPREGTPTISLLTTRRPKNIVFLIWESLSAHFIAPLGGKDDITVNLNRLCSEGVLFDRVHAGSYRTDPGLICTLSGYPGHPTTSIMRNTHVLPYLPSLPRHLKEAGYSTTAIQGGDLSIQHKIDYFLAAGFERMVSINDMPKDAPRGPWGVHDNYMYDWLYRDMEAHADDPGQRFVMFLSLSSHQPYKVPSYARLDDEIENSYSFTDEAFGRFIDRMKASPMWDDTLIVVLGDHGISTHFLPQPRHIQPHIPILWLGGVVRQPMVIDTIMSQTDLAATLLGQLGLPHDDLIFSRDVLADTYTDPFSMHIYNNGFLYRDATGYTDFDNVARQAIDGADPERERRGRVFMQQFLTDLAHRRPNFTKRPK